MGEQIDRGNNPVSNPSALGATTLRRLTQVGMDMLHEGFGDAPQGVRDPQSVRTSPPPLGQSEEVTRHMIQAHTWARRQLQGRLRSYD